MEAILHYAKIAMLGVMPVTCVLTGQSLDCTHNISEDGVISTDICGLGPPDYINMTCSLRYSGNVAPTLSWSEDNVAVTAHKGTSLIIPNVQVTSTVVIEARKDMNCSRFMCSGRIIWSTDDATFTETNKTWTSSIFNMLCK